jgi:hypothetical protein
MTYPEAPTPPPGPPQPAQAGGFGPPGQIRSIGVCILLAIVTLGIYTYVWVWKTSDEIKNNSGVGVGGPVAFIIYFIVSPVTYFLLPSEVRQMLERYGQPSRVSGLTGLWILLPLAGPIVWFVKVQGQLNDHWHALGATKV